MMQLLYWSDLPDIKSLGSSDVFRSPISLHPLLSRGILVSKVLLEYDLPSVVLSVYASMML